jgi:hypothetical protein
LYNAKTWNISFVAVSGDIFVFAGPDTKTLPLTATKEMFQVLTLCSSLTFLTNLKVINFYASFGVIQHLMFLTNFKVLNFTQHKTI